MASASSEWVVVEELDKLHADVQTTLTMVGGEAAHIISPLPASLFECAGACSPQPAPSFGSARGLLRQSSLPIPSIHPHVHRQTYQMLRLHLNEFLATLQDDHDRHHDVSESIIGYRLLDIIPTSEERPRSVRLVGCSKPHFAEVSQSAQP